MKSYIFFCAIWQGALNGYVGCTSIAKASEFSDFGLV
jgi:hypothetical protein